MNAARDSIFDHVPTDEQIIMSAYEILAQRHAIGRSRDRRGVLSRMSGDSRLSKQDSNRPSWADSYPSCYAAKARSCYTPPQHVWPYYIPGLQVVAGTYNLRCAGLRDGDIQSRMSFKMAWGLQGAVELLAQGGRDMSHTEISEALQIPKSSLSQLLKTLVARRYLEVVSNGHGYQLRQAFLRLSNSIGRARDLVSLAGPLLEEVTRETGESSALNQIKGDMAKVTATVLGPARLVTHMRLGDLAPLYATSGGKAILANMPDEFQRQYLANVQLEPATPATLKSVTGLKKQLAIVRASGFAYSREEWTPGIIGIATGVLGADGYVLGAINVAIPAPRFTEAAQTKCEHALGRAAEGLRRLLVPRR